MEKAHAKQNSHYDVKKLQCQFAPGTALNSHRIRVNWGLLYEPLVTRSIAILHTQRTNATLHHDPQCALC